MSTTCSFFLVQWMPGPCTEGGINKEFSIIGTEDIKENYRYALEAGRITMATYRFKSGPNIGTMHRLCKVLGASGDKSSLEQDMVHMMNNTHDQAGIDRIVYTIDEDEKPTHLVTNQGAEGGQATMMKPSRPPAWEVEREMLKLLEENHKLGRENDSLRDKLAKAVDVSDLKNILETTMLNIQQKQLTQPTSRAGQAVPDHQIQPTIDTLQFTSNLLSQDSNQVQGSVTSMSEAFPILASVPRQHVSRQAPSMNSLNQQQPRQVASIVEVDNPYILRVQSLAEPTPHQMGHVGQVMQGTNGMTGASMNARIRGFTTETQSSQYSSQSQGVPQRQQTSLRQIKPPLWQTNYVADGIVERLRNVRGGQQGQQATTDVIEVPTTSNQGLVPIRMKPQRMFTQDSSLPDLDGDKLVELVGGLGIKISRRQLKMAQRTRNFSQYTRNLMMLVFSGKELSLCSVTGYKATGRGSENAVARPALDQRRVHGIITAVQRRFPTVSHFKVKQIMSQKLMDIRKTMRNKQLRNITWKRKSMNTIRVKGQAKTDELL